MFSWLFSLFCSDLIIELHKDKILSRKIDDETIIETSPFIEMDGQKINIFSHPRILISRFDPAVSIFQKLIIDHQGRMAFNNPRVLIQNKIILDGGITEVEERLLMNSFERGGARKVVVLSSDAHLNIEEASKAQLISKMNGSL